MGPSGNTRAFSLGAAQNRAVIAFATFFLGIVFGLSTVELVPGEGVTRVELYLDGTRVADLTQPPWQVTVDLGKAPEPHQLLAIARDANGNQTGRAEQWINRPRRLAEASLVLQPGKGGKGRVVTLSWEAVTAKEPTEVRVTFDGKALQTGDLASILLPDYVPEQVHFVRAELEFPEHVVAVAEIVFGGRQNDETQSELTAVLVSVDPGARLPAPSAMEGWLMANGRPLRVLAVEEGPAEVVVVVDQTAAAALEQLSYAERAGRFVGALKRDQRLRFLWPLPERRKHSGFEYRLFPESEDFTPTDGSMAWLFSRVVKPAAITKENQKITDALAVAALSAASRDRRRAVVLVTGAEPRDQSSLPVPALRSFLSALHTPLYVLSTEKEPPAAASAWGRPRTVATRNRLDQAMSDLSDDLKRQRVLWVEGKLRPQEVFISPLAVGLGAADPESPQ